MLDTLIATLLPSWKWLRESCHDHALEEQRLVMRLRLLLDEEVVGFSEAVEV
jgi:hypothetical protein